MSGDEWGLPGRPALQFQPAVDLATGRLLGFEALVRWEHPDDGLLPPSVVIPWAEEHGAIVELNAWVFEEACRCGQRWPSGIQLAANCSLTLLRNGSASTSVAAALESTGFNPDRLTIEVTERTVADDRASADLRALTALGVHLAVDDVGTSWSSLQPLRRFAVETVKIDGAFIAGLEADEGMNRAIVEAIVHVAHSLAMSTVAEGVESAEQVAILREFGADVAQGYFFAHPVSVDQAEELANTEPRPVFALTAGRAMGGAHPAVQPRPLSVLSSTGPSAGTAPAARVEPTPQVAALGSSGRMSSTTVSPVRPSAADDPDTPEDVGVALDEIVAEAARLEVPTRANGHAHSRSGGDAAAS